MLVTYGSSSGSLPRAQDWWIWRWLSSAGESGRTSVAERRVWAYPTGRGRCKTTLHYSTWLFIPRLSSHFPTQWLYWLQCPTSMGPMDLSRFFSCSSVVEVDNPSMETVQRSFPGALWLCLVDGGRPRPICPAPRPRPRPDTTTYRQRQEWEWGPTDIYRFKSCSSITFRDRNFIISRQRTLFSSWDIFSDRERGCACVLGVGERSGACFSLSASVSVVSVTAAWRWQACREARGPGVASLCYTASSLSILLHLAHCPVLLPQRLSACHQRRGTTLQRFQLYFAIISISGAPVS